MLGLDARKWYGVWLDLQLEMLLLSWRRHGNLIVQFQCTRHHFAFIGRVLLTELIGAHEMLPLARIHSHERVNLLPDKFAPLFGQGAHAIEKGPRLRPLLWRHAVELIDSFQDALLLIGR